MLTEEASSEHITTVVQAIGHRCSIDLHRGSEDHQFVPLTDLEEEEEEGRIDRFSCVPHRFQEIIDVWPFVDKESHWMPFDLYANDEIRRTRGLGSDHPREAIVMGVNQRFIEIQDENLLRKKI